MNDFVSSDKQIKNNLLEYEGNILILANAGSGKTTFLVKKLLHDAKSLKTYKKLAAITFTRNATEEIQQRLIDMPESVTVSTIDWFLEKEIIFPFIDQTYEINNDFKFSYQKEHKIKHFEEGLEQIKNEGIFGTYADITARTGKNFKCDVALKILKETISASEYLQYRFHKIYIDEYQDCDQSMHNLFMYFTNELGIQLFIVGDDKQSIYQWRGASPQYIKDIWRADNSFKKEKFVHNYRSLAKIVEFSLAMTEDKKVEELSLEGDILYLETPNYSLIEDIICFLDENDYINLEESNFFLIGNNNHIQDTLTRLNREKPQTFDYIKRNPFIDCTNAVFLQGIAHYYFQDDFSEYDFLNSVYPIYDDVFRRGILKKLEALKKNPTKHLVEEIASYIDIKVTEYDDKLESDILIEELRKPENRKIFDHKTLSNNLLMTIHSSKGLSADTVVVFVDYLIDRNGKLKFEEHYVAITRPKSKLIIVNKGKNYKAEVNKIMRNGYSITDFVEEIEYIKQAKN